MTPYFEVMPSGRASRCPKCGAVVNGVGATEDAAHASMAAAQVEHWAALHAEDPLWVREFEARTDSSYAVPAEVADALEDQSWHNDTCPSFGATDSDVRLWVEHPLVEEREATSERPPARFTVTGGGGAAFGLVVFEGDDVEAALAAYHAAIAEEKR